MTAKNKLWLSYFISLALLAAFVAAFALSWFGLGILFYFLFMLARWGINPTRTAYKNVWHSGLGKICGLLLASGILGLIVVVVIQNYGSTKLPGWLIRFWLYGFLIPSCIPLFCLTIKEEIKAANIADNKDEN